MKYLAVIILSVAFLELGAARAPLRNEVECGSLEQSKNGNWSKVKEGNVTQLYPYGDYMYAVGTDKAVYRYSLWHHGDWKKVASGNVSSISINNGHLYGVLDDKSVSRCRSYRCNEWKKIADGKVNKIVVRDGYIFALKQDMEDDAVWQTTYDGYWPYRRVTQGTTLDLAFTSNFMYGLGEDGGIWKSPKDGSWPWKNIAPPNNIVQISASNNYIYGLDKNGVVWRNNYGKNPWEKFGDGRKILHVAARVLDCGGAEIYAVGENNDVLML